MATVTAKRTYRGTIDEDGTVTVSGQGECRVKIVGNDYGGGTLSILDNLTGEFVTVDDEGVALTLTTGNQSYYLRYNPYDQVDLRLSLASSTSPDIDAYVSFDKAPPG